MRISICFGTLNRRKFLVQAIKSVLSEANKYDLDIEVIPADGGSIDGTVEYLTKMSDPRVKPILIGKHSSYPDFMNRAIKHSTGKVIVQWNDDAFMCPGGWETLEENAKKHLDNQSIWGFRFLHCSLDAPPSVEFFKTEHPQWQRHFIHMRDHHFMCFGAYYRRAFERFGLYHPDILFYHCDTEFCRRVVALTGDKYASVPFLSECKVHHIKTITGRQDMFGSSGEQDRRMSDSIVAWVRKNRKVPLKVDFLGK